MRVLDRYILRSFLMNFLILTVVIVSMVIVVDLILDPGEFIQAGQVRAGRFGSTLVATIYSVFDYWYPLVLLLYVFFSGLLVVGAMGFTFAGLSKTGELVAMITGGQSMHRIAAPVIIAGCLLNALALPIQEVLIPPLANKLLRGKSEVKEESLGTFPVWYARDSQRNLVSAAAFDPLKGELTQVSVLLRTEEGRAAQRVSADSAVWRPAGETNRVEGWVLNQGLVVDRSAKPRADAGVQATGRPMTFLATDLSPTVLLAKRAAIYPRLLGMQELMRMAASPAADPPVMWRIIHSRFAFVVLNSLLMIVAMPFFLTREPVNYMVQAIKATTVCMAVWATGLFVMQTGVGLGQPVTEAWAPVLASLPLVVWMGQSVKT